MSVVVCSKRKYVGPENNKSKGIVEVIYDFSVDAGAVADYTLLTASGACVVKMLYLDVLTAVTSGTSAVEISCGKGAGGTDFVNAALPATLTLNYVIGSTAVVKLASTNVISMGAAVEAITAGKIKFVFEILAA
jgi:hypothetical protein